MVAVEVVVEVDGARAMPPVEVVERLQVLVQVLLPHMCQLSVALVCTNNAPRTLADPVLESGINFLQAPTMTCKLSS